jgi:hypothetical protein
VAGVEAAGMDARVQISQYGELPEVTLVETGAIRDRMEDWISEGTGVLPTAALKSWARTAALQSSDTVASATAARRGRVIAIAPE